MKAEKFNHPLLNMMNSPSSAADMWTRKQQEAEKDTVEDNQAVNAPAHTYDELKKMRRNAYIKMVAIVGIIVTALAFGSVAWFTQSREVEGSAVQMNAEDIPFELMVIGDTTRATMFQYIKENNEAIYSIGSLFNDVAKHFVTGPAKEDMQIQWAGGTDEELEPGQSGDLTFYIVPNKKMTASEFVAQYGDLNIFQLEMKGYRTVEEENATTGKKEITGLTDIAAMPKFRGTLPYLNGHLLVFKEHKVTKNNNNEIISDKYSGLIDTNERFSLEDTDYSIEPDGTVKVVLHWKWPATFPKMIGTYSVNENIAENAETTTDILEYTILHADRVLYGKEAQTISEEESSSITETLLLGKMNANLNDLSKLYNKADSRIGADVHYVLFVLNAKCQ